MQDAINDSQLVTKPKVAEMLGFTVRTVENQMRAGRIPYLKIGRNVRFNLSDVLAHLNDNCRVVRK